MIEHVWRSAMDAGLGPVLVASPDKEILTVVRDFGGIPLETSPHHRSGSDRMAEALAQYDPDNVYEVAINLQGDIPFVGPQTLRTVMEPLREPAVDLATLAVEQPTEAIDHPSRVKIVGTLLETGSLRAIYFSRALIPYGSSLFYQHIGVYAFRRAALYRFAALRPSSLEMLEKLEQLRALEAGMRIDAAIVDRCPASIDTPEDLELFNAEVGSLKKLG